MKADDSSLEDEQYRTVREAAIKLLDRAGARGIFPTPVDELLSAADLKLAPVSAFDERSMLSYLREAGHQAGQLLRRAVEKVLGVLDVHANTVHVDTTVSGEKQTFLKLHETGHNEIPHQKGLYRWVQDCQQCLTPEVAALFEREANTFASIVLFQDDGFAAMARDSEFGIKVPMRTAKKFGASVYAGIREYVRRSDRACAAIVLNPCEFKPDIGYVAAVRRTELSPLFRTQYGNLGLPLELTSVDDMMRFVPMGGRRMSRPDTFRLTDLNGTVQEFIGEGFATPFNVFLLIHARTTLKGTIIIPR